MHGPARITNVAVQDVCPSDNPDHMVIGTTDPVSWALIKDALDHDGPANPARIPLSVCAEGVMPGVDSPLLATDIAAAAAYVAQSGAYPQVPAEPALRCYVTASCLAVPTPTPTTTTCHSRRLLTVTIPATMPVVVRATLDGRTLRVQHRGHHRILVLDLRGRPRGPVTLLITGRNRAGRVVREFRLFHTCVPFRRSA